MKVKKKWMQMLAVFATILALPLTGKAVGDETQKVLDLTKADCTLTIEAGEGFEADTSFDLYKVAGLEKVKGYDGYQYVAEDDSLIGATEVIKQANNLLLAEGRASAEQTMQLASDTAELISGGMPEKGFVESKEYDDSEGEGSGNIVFDGLEVGLYLIIARGTDLNTGEYFVETAKLDDERNPEKKYAATMAYSEDEIYTFQAMLVTVPGLTPSTGTEFAWTYPWVYDVEIILQSKYETSPRYASLNIEKNLTDFREGSAVTFYFSVEAEKDGENVYSNVIPISFEEPGVNKSVVIDRIPAGADVEIREIYSGAAYDREGTVNASAESNRGMTAENLNVAAIQDGIRIKGITAGNIQVTNGEGEVIVNAGDTITVSFRNAYNNSGMGGGSVVNSFDKDENGGWTLQKTYTDSNGIRTEGVGNAVNPDDGTEN